MVVGSISTDEWETDAGRRSKPRIRARAVGHNLHRGISSFRKLSRPGASPVEETPAESVDSGLPVDPSDEQYGETVDRFTGELLPGRDYVTDPATLHSLTSDDLSTEPAHA